jgi:hypothetical protein
MLAEGLKGHAAVSRARVLSSQCDENLLPITSGVDQCHHILLKETHPGIGAYRKLTGLTGRTFVGMILQNCRKISDGRA